MVWKTGLRALCAACLAAAALAAAEKVAPEKLPAKVTDGVAKEVAGAKWTEATRYTDDGEVWFSLEGTDGKGRDVWAEVSADGDVAEVQTEVGADGAPAAVRDAVKKEMPKAKFTSVIQVRDLYEETVVYHLERNEEGPKAAPYVWVEVTDKGEIQEAHRAVAKVPDAVLKALRAKFPRLAISSQLEVREKGTVVRYDFEGRRPKAKDDISVSVSADGKTVEVDE
ncbi:MAG: hypothetical protein ACRC33_09765 [Gemmataceae bacterium]